MEQNGMFNVFSLDSMPKFDTIFVYVFHTNLDQSCPP